MAKFEKGKSGNPGGRPKLENNVKELARAYTAEAIERLAGWMRDSDPKASIPASIALLNRAWGTPAQAVEVSGPEGGPQVVKFVDGPSQETFEQWAARRARMTAQSAIATPSEDDSDD